MKKLLLAINLILFGAVGYLYYIHFSSVKKQQTNASNSATVKNNPDPKSTIAYIELDSLNEQIAYIKQKRKDLEAEQKSIEAEWQNGYRRLQAQRDNFLKKGASSQAEMEQMQNSLLQQQQQIDGAKQTKSQKLSEKSFSFMDNFQKQLKEFLVQYNKDKKYMYIFTAGSGLDNMVYKDSAYNITKDVIVGMNEKMKDGK